MKSLAQPLVKLWRKVFPPPKPVVPAQPVRLVSEERKVPARFAAIEPLEGRIAPATLLNPSTLVYKDVDGDMVTVKFSKALFNLATNPTLLHEQLDKVFTFSPGNAWNGTDAGQQLQFMDLSLVPNVSLSNPVNPASGTSVTITVKAGLSATGDLKANIGAINGGALALGTVSIAGDLGQIDCGNSRTTTGLQALKVYSLGAVADSQRGVANFESKIVGALGSLHVTANIHEAFVHVVDGAAVSGQIITFGKIGNVYVGGSLEGRTIAGGASNSTGAIKADGNIGAVTIVGDLKGGAGVSSGTVIAGGAIKSLHMAGSMIGAAGTDSGSVTANTNIGSVFIGGNISGGTGTGSGLLHSKANLGAVRIVGGILGNDSPGGGGIFSDGNIAAVTISGSITGGTKDHSGSIEAAGNIGSVKVLGDIVGGSGYGSAAIVSSGKLGAVTVTGKLQGGSGGNSGSIFGNIDPSLPQDTGPVKVGKFLSGGSGSNSAIISAGGRLVSVTIGTAGSADPAITGGPGSYSASVFAGGSIGAVKISGNVNGGPGLHSSSIQSFAAIGPVTIAGSVSGGPTIEAAGNVKSVTVTGSFSNSAVRAGDSLGLVSITGALDHSVLSGRGQAVQGATSDVAIVGVNAGSVINSQILAGYSVAGEAVNPDAQIGRIKVAGNWTASSVAAGIVDNGGNGFGNGDDTAIQGADNPAIIARIAAISIGGSVSGTASSASDHFGFVAREIGAFKIGATPLSLHSNSPDPVVELDSLNNDCSLREIAPV